MYEKGEIVNVDKDFQEIIPSYLYNLTDNIETMKSHLKKQNYDAIKKIGHGIRGTGGGYGFDAITDMGKYIEEAAKKSNVEKIEKWLQILLDYVENVNVVYNS